MQPSLSYALSTSANQALDALRQLRGEKFLPGVDGSSLLCERATLMNLKPQGQVSANGCCYLLQTTDSWVALNLSRDSDWQLLPALFQSAQPFTTLDQVRAQVLQVSAATLVERASLLGLPLADAKYPSPDHSQNTLHNKDERWFAITGKGKTGLSKKEKPRVLDLSSLWAGPLCSRLLQLAGASVTKVESTQRPDGARLNTQTGGREFYERLNKNKTRVELDFKNPQDTKKLKQLIEQADIVIEGSRPRALQQLGINADELVQQQAGLVWCSITGYGRSKAQANRVAFGDDAAIGAGLFQVVDNKPVFIGDAIADPLTGLHAALAAFAFSQQGQSVLLDINLHTIAKHCSRCSAAENPLYSPDVFV